MDIHKIAEYERIAEQKIIQLTKEAYKRSAKVQKEEFINEIEKLDQNYEKFREIKRSRLPDGNKKKHHKRNTETINYIMDKKFFMMKDLKERKEMDFNINFPQNKRVMFEEDQDKYKIEEVDEEEVQKQKEIEWKNRYQHDIRTDNGILPREVRRDKILNLLKTNYGIDDVKNTKAINEIKKNKNKNQAGLPPIPEKNKRKVKSHVNHGIFFNGVQLLKPKIAASEKEAIMSKQRFNDAKRKAWSQNDTDHNFITEENIQLLRHKSGKLSKPIKPVKYGGKDYNKPLGHKELMKFRDQIREHHHIDIQDVITKDLKLKKALIDLENVQKEEENINHRYITPEKGHFRTLTPINIIDGLDREKEDQKKLKKRQNLSPIKINKDQKPKRMFLQNDEAAELDPSRLELEYKLGIRERDTMLDEDTTESPFINKEYGYLCNIRDQVSDDQVKQIIQRSYQKRSYHPKCASISYAKPEFLENHSVETSPCGAKMKSLTRLDYRGISSLEALHEYKKSLNPGYEFMTNDQKRSKEVESNLTWSAERVSCDQMPELYHTESLLSLSNVERNPTALYSKSGLIVNIYHKELPKKDSKDKKKIVIFDEENTKPEIIRKNRLDYAPKAKTVTKYEKAKSNFIKKHPNYKPVATRNVEFKKDIKNIKKFQSDEYKRLGIRGIFGEEDKLDDIERAILEKNRLIIIKKKKNDKEAKIDTKIKNFTNSQLKGLIKQDRKLLSKKKRVWRGMKGNFDKEQLKGYFKKIDAAHVFNQRKKFKSKKLFG
ncbi:unnamed protein product [Moneuplotes crassus]|uniref:Uncharacterized protein n=1 Tax=Euplotes crassus TaxID=5936 RepID=A0AAD1XVP6_EUPCR|nr:unnamed protein product [Moneuplotes crassus]